MDVIPHRAEDAAFSPLLLSVVSRPPSPLPKMVLYTLLALVASTLFWASFGRLDIVARANGQLIPEGRVQIVQPLDNGRVARILVREGDRVRAGQPLLLMDSDLSDADMEKLEASLALVRLQLRRVGAELDDVPLTPADGDDAGLYRDVAAQYRAHRQAYRDRLDQQRAVLAQARQALAESLTVQEALEEMLPLHQASEAAYLSLGEKGHIGRLAVLERKRERIAAEQQLRSQRFEVEALRAGVREARARMRQIDADYRRGLLEEKLGLEDQATRLERDLEKARYRLAGLQLRAPRDGVVQEIATHTVGFVVPAGTVLLTVVPADGPLQAEVMIENKDVGFVHTGQTARLKLLSYSFQRYGTVDASVGHLDADAAGATESEKGSGGYRALLSLAEQSLAHAGRRLPLRPGMAVSAEINLGSRTVLEYILSPIVKVVAEAGTER